MQRTTGFLDVDLSFKDQIHRLRMLIVPSLSQRFILGLDFWKTFDLAPPIFNSAILYDIPLSLIYSKNLSELSSIN